MHDFAGRPLAVGDRVLVPFKITSVSANDEYCNVTLETEAVMFPSDRKTTLTANTKQVIRNNDGDSTTFDVADGALVSAE